MVSLHCFFEKVKKISSSFLIRFLPVNLFFDYFLCSFALGGLELIYLRYLYFYFSRDRPSILFSSSSILLESSSLLIKDDCSSFNFFILRFLLTKKPYYILIDAYFFINSPFSSYFFDISIWTSRILN